MDCPTLFGERRADSPFAGADHDRLATSARPARQSASVPGQPRAGRNADLPRRAAIVLDVRTTLRAGADRRARTDSRGADARTDGRRTPLVRATELPESDGPPPAGRA